MNSIRGIRLSHRLPEGGTPLVVGILLFHLLLGCLLAGSGNGLALAAGPDHCAPAHTTPGDHPHCVGCYQPGSPSTGSPSPGSETGWMPCAPTDLPPHTWRSRIHPLELGAILPVFLPPYLRWHHLLI